MSLRAFGEACLLNSLKERSTSRAALRLLRSSLQPLSLCLCFVLFLRFPLCVCARARACARVRVQMRVQVRVRVRVCVCVRVRVCAAAAVPSDEIQRTGLDHTEMARGQGWVLLLCSWALRLPGFAGKMTDELQSLLDGIFDHVPYLTDVYADKAPSGLGRDMGLMLWVRGIRLRRCVLHAAACAIVRCASLEWWGTPPNGGQRLPSASEGCLWAPSNTDKVVHATHRRPTADRIVQK